MTDTGSINYIEFIENTGFTLTTDIAEQVYSAPVATLRDFRERYLELLATFHYRPPSKLVAAGDAQSGRVFTCPDAGRGEFRPLIHGRITRLGDKMLSGDSGADFEELRLDQRLRRIKSLLLYCHSIVVADGLFYVNQWLDSGQDKYIERSRCYLANYLTIVTHLRPLIEQNIVLIYPQYEHTGVGFGRSVDRSFRDTDFEEWFFKSPHSRADPTLGVVYRHINELLFFAHRYDATLLLRGPRQRAATNLILQHAGRAARKDKADDEHLAQEFASIELPGLDHLSLRDIIDIRRNDEVFDGWRKALAGAIEKVDSYKDIEFPLVMREVKDILYDGQEALKKGIRDTSLWNQTRDPLGKFGLTAVSGLIAKGAFDLPTAAVAAGLSFLYGYLRGGQKRRSAKSLRRHISALTSDLNR